MKKAVSALLAIAMAAELAACSSITRVNINNTLSTSVNGTMTEDESGKVTVASGEALVIEHDVKKGSFVVRVRNMGDDVFFDDVAKQDSPIYVTGVQGACNVGVYTEDTEGSINVHTCDVEEVPSDARRAHVSLSASTGPRREGESEGDVNYTNERLGVAYCAPIELETVSKDERDGVQGEWKSFEYWGRSESASMLCFVYDADTIGDVMDEAGRSSLVEDIRSSMEAEHAQNIQLEADTYLVDGVSCYRVQTSCDKDDIHLFRTWIVVPRDEDPVLLSGIATTKTRVDELIDGIRLQQV